MLTRRWREIAVPNRDQLRAMGARMIHGYRNGDLAVIVADEPTGWHLSISHPDRYPTWDEIADARYDLLNDHLTMALLLPPRRQYVNLQPNTFHLHEIESDDDTATPPGMARSHETGLLLPP
jgi:hypothetical protein